MKSFKQLRLEREQLARSEALNRYILSLCEQKSDLKAQLIAGGVSFGLLLAILCTAAYGVIKTGGL
jgi:hypothetical protein